ncbi:MAG: vitamin K epoxide reductase family protein, partial [Saonia sp.]
VLLLAEQKESPVVFQGHGIKWVGMALVVLLSILLWSTIPSLIFCLIGVFGLYLSNEIFETMNDHGSNFGQRICGQEEESSCAKVLKSKAYYLGPFSLNDLFFSFLLSTLMLALLNTGLGSIHMLIYLMAILMVMVTIGIQAFVLKSWCRLCLLSSTMVIVQFVVIFNSSSFREPLLSDNAIFLVLKDAMVLGLLFSIALLGIYRYRKLKTQYYELSTGEIELLRFKRSPKMVKLVLSNAKRINHREGADQLIIGNRTADHTIRLVLSTSCKYCKKEFDKFYDFYKKKGEDYRFQLIFNHFKTASPDAKRNQIAATMINAYGKKGSDEFLKLMDGWFQHQNEENFADLDFDEAQHKILLEQRVWCEKNELFHTPILIINEKIIPPDYNASFLEDMLNAMEEKE